MIKMNGDTKRFFLLDVLDAMVSENVCSQCVDCQREKKKKEKERSSGNAKY